MRSLRERFGEFMELRNLAARTRESYIYALVGLSKYYNQSPETITQEMIWQYILYLQNEGQKSFSSCNIAISAFKCFYNQFLGDGTIIFKVPSRRGPKKLPVIYSQEEVHKIIQNAKSPKYRLMFMTAYGAGLRLGELINLRVCDIDSKRMTILVRSAKGNKDRRALLPNSLLSELKPYYRMFRPEKWLFFSARPDKKLCKDSVSRAFREAKQKAGVSREGGIHALRHCFATHMLEAGTDIKTVQHLLGHADISSTMVYLHVTNKLIGLARSPLDEICGNPDDSRGEPEDWNKGGDDE